MNDTDLTILWRFVAALSPAQQWDEFTVDAWSGVLPRDFTLEECRAAVLVIKRRQTWLDPHDIYAEVRRARGPAEEAERLRILTSDPAALNARNEAADAAALARIEARLGRRARLKAVPPPGYGGQAAP